MQMFYDAYKPLNQLKKIDKIRRMSYFYNKKVNKKHEYSW